MWFDLFLRQPQLRQVTPAREKSVHVNLATSGVGAKCWQSKQPSRKTSSADFVCQRKTEVPSYSMSQAALWGSTTASGLGQFREIIWANKFFPSAFLGKLLQFSIMYFSDVGLIHA